MAALEWIGSENCLRADAGAHGIYTIEPWHAEFQLKHNGNNGCIHKTVELAKAWAQNIVTDAESPTPRRGLYALADFAPFIHFRDEGAYDTRRKLLPLPNAEPQDLGRGVNNIASLGHMLTPMWGYSYGEHCAQWTQFFLNVSDGSGYALIYGGKGGRIVTFTICRHQKRMHAGANPSRGWHPGYCIKCGLDMTYDSGD